MKTHHVMHLLVIALKRICLGPARSESIDPGSSLRMPRTAQAGSLQSEERVNATETEQPDLVCLAGSGQILLKLLLGLLVAGLFELPEPVDGVGDGALPVDLIVARADIDCATGFLLFTDN